MLHDMMAQEQQTEMQKNTNNIFLCFQDIEIYLKLFHAESFLKLFLQMGISMHEPSDHQGPLDSSHVLYLSLAHFFF